MHIHTQLRYVLYYFDDFIVDSIKIKSLIKRNYTDNFVFDLQMLHSQEF